MIGYHTLEGYGWVDSFFKRSHAHGRHGAVGTLHTDAGKIFAGIYALYCGFIVLVAIGIFAAPIFHRFLHHFPFRKREKSKTNEAFQPLKQSPYIRRDKQQF